MRLGSYFAALPVGRQLNPAQIRALYAAWEIKVDRICRSAGLSCLRFHAPMIAAIEAAVAAANGTAGVEPRQLQHALRVQLEHLMPVDATTYELGVAFGAALALASEWEAF